VAAGGDSALLEAEEAYRVHLLRDRPDLATRFGIRGGDERLVPVTEATLPEDSTSLETFADQLAALGRGPMKRSDRERLNSLRARVERERAPYVSGAWRRDPSLYLELGPRAVLEAATIPKTGSCRRLGNAVGRLRALPEVLRAARVLLRGGASGDTATAPWLAAMDSLRVLPTRLAGCRDPGREAALVEADSLALAACDRFVRFLGESRPRAGAVDGRDE
jgi:hypothetical protein